MQPRLSETSKSSSVSSSALASKPSTWQLFRLWCTIGLQSFGGGASTIFLIQRTFTETYPWLTIEEIAGYWSLCILTPGINLIALTVLIGRKLGGARGIAASLAGLLLPSATITCLLTALFTQIERFNAVQAVIRGVIPATGAVMLLVGLNFALPIFKSSYKIGVPYLAGSIVVIAACFAAVAFLKLPVVLVIGGAIVLGAILFQPSASHPALPVEEEKGSQQ